MLYGLETICYDGTCDVNSNFNTYFKLLLNKVISLFKVEGLPPYIDKNWLLAQLVLSGRVCFTKFNDRLYCLDGNLGGEPNCYYIPTYFIIANPILKSKRVKVYQLDGSDSLEGLDGIVVNLTTSDYFSDTQRGGYYGLIYQTAGLLADNISSLNCAQINSRAVQFFTADSQAQANSAEVVLKDIYSGKPFKVLEQNILEKLTINPASSAGTNQNIMQLIEAHQYILAQFYNEIGISANFNMKRERLNTAEVELNSGSLDLNIENVLETIGAGIDRVNAMFGTSIKISLNEDVREEVGTEVEPETETEVKTEVETDAQPEVETEPATEKESDDNDKE